MGLNKFVKFVKLLKSFYPKMNKLDTEISLHY